ncbi:MAG: hypothetical protein ACKOBW_08030 [Planctomycetota bacterium]
MTNRFVDQEVRRPVECYQPIAAPLDPHPTRGSWLNRGREFYEQAFGAEAYASNSRRDVPFPMPENTFGERLNFHLRMRKAQFLFGGKALATGRRATHMAGVGAKGTITIVARPEFPEHDFFRPGRVFSGRLRHANASFYDDASCQVRACSLKFADHDFTSPFDLIMNTGVIQAFWSFDTFMQFVSARVLCREDYWEPQRDYMCRLPGAFIGAIESVRVAPSSYAAMLYHSSIVYPFRARDGRLRYAKYRLVPVDLQQESGLADQQYQQAPGVQCRHAGDTHPRQYLGDEYCDRLSCGEIAYQLQIQLREFDLERDTWEFFNGGRVWEPTEYPWLDLATVRMTEAMSAAQTEVTRMWLGHQPPSLGLTAAFSAVDYRSLAVARYRVYPWSRRASWLLRSLHRSRRLRTDF